MKLTLDWLRDFVDLPTEDPAEIAEVLVNLGHEVESWQKVEPSFRGVVIGRVEEVKAHPDADRIRVCQVDIGREQLEIVCGAWNFEVGAVVPVAVPGAVLQQDMEVGRRKIRGVVSNGMICSEKELDLGDDAEGIMVLNDDYPEAVESSGEDLTTVLPAGDALFDVSITPNRPDAMSVLGIARELAAFYSLPLQVPEVGVAGQEPAGSTVVTIEDPVGCPRFAAREVRNVTVGPSPHWMRARLTAAGVRPISNVVDASNYAMLELGHPTHAFDLDRLGDTVVVRRARSGESVTTLDGVERPLEPTDMVVADADRALAIAGIMGGADTEVNDDTTRVLVEAAYWEPASIMLSSKRLGLRTEASARFERGMDPNFCAIAVDRVAQLLERIAGAVAASGIADAYPSVIEPATVALPLGEIPRVLGIDLDAGTITGLLGRLGLDARGADPLEITVPTFRPDIKQAADLIEEVARLYGYDKIPERIATGNGGGLPRREQRMRRIREVLVGSGFHEVLTYSFLGPADLDALMLPEADPRRDGIVLANPLREEEGIMRTTVLPGLLKAAAINAAREIGDVALFEIGKVFLPGGGKLPEQPDRLGFVAMGLRERGWASPAEPQSVWDALGTWQRLANTLRLPETSVRAAQAHGFHPGRGAEVLVTDTVVGVVGEIHPKVARAFGIEERLVGGEIDLEPLLMDRGAWQFSPPSTYPPHRFDLAFELEESVPAATLLKAIDAAAGSLLEKREIFDVFAGAPLAAGRKSIAVRLTLRASDRTLTDEAVQPVRRDIVSAVEKATGGELRGEV